MKRTLFAALTLAMALPLAASAQAGLDSSQAQGFLGTWSVSFDSPQGAFVMDIAIVDSSGKVTATVSNDMMGTQDVTDISRADANLVLRYEMDVQGQTAPIALTLMPAGDGVTATMDFADGMYVMDGTGSKK
jgi:hypothetical protein